MIVRNEGRTIYDALMSALPYVDEVVIGFAGESTDNTGDEVRRAIEESQFLGDVQFLSIDWVDNFSHARNVVLDATTQPYVLWLDGDDVLIGGEKMRGYIDRFPDAAGFYMGYDYARDEFGNNTCFLVRERIVKVDQGWRWIGAIHEVLAYASAENDERRSAHVPDVWVEHHKPADKNDPRRNLDILYSQLELGEPNPDPRILAYLGSENAGRGNLTEALLHWQRFVMLSGWDEEKYQTLVKMADTYRALGNLAKSLQTAYHAIELAPSWPDAYICLARTYMTEPINKYPVALEWLKVASAKPIPETMLIVNPQQYSFELGTLVAICHTMLNDPEMALEQYKNVYAVRPDPLVLEQIRLLSQEMDAQQAFSAFKKLREYLARHDEWLKVRQLLDLAPHNLVHMDEMNEIRQRTMQQTGHIDDPQIMVDFYTGNPHWTPINEDEIKKSSWLDYPRMAYALSVAERTNAKNIIDWGCSDGFISLPLARETGSTVYGFDLDPRCVELANSRATSWDVDAGFRVGNVDDLLNPEYWTAPRADLAIFFEVIEHVVDPDAILEGLERTARHIAITTPFKAWENGNIPAWDKLEPKGHLRIFDLEDMERLIKPRGRISNLYRQPWGQSGWIFCDYAPGEQATGPRITIGAGFGTETWGPQRFRAEGLGGSETAVIRLGEELTQLGGRVTVYNPIDEPGYYNEVCYRDISKFQAAVRSDMYIAWRMPEAADWDINTGRLILWMHDTDAGDRLTPDRAKRFDNFVVLTEWHKQFFLDKYPFIPADKIVVIGNGVDLERFGEPVTRDPKKVVYSSSPDRGLDIILEHIWPVVIERVPDAELHVYYGWKNFDVGMNTPGYGFMRQFKEKVQNLFINTRNVVQHGRISQARLAKELQEATIWLYPTYFHETYCITAIEAQLAGAIPVTNHLAGLAETVKSGVIIEGSVFEPNTQAKFAEAVINVLTSPDREKMHQEVIKNAPAQSWSAVASQFLALEATRV